MDRPHKMILVFFSWLFRIVGLVGLVVAVIAATNVVSWYTGLDYLLQPSYRELFQIFLIIIPAIPLLLGIIAFGVGALIDIRISIKNISQQAHNDKR